MSYLGRVDKLKNKDFRNSYIESKNMLFLSMQIKAMRGKMTQKKFAEKLGISQQLVSAFENGQRYNMTLSSIFNIAEKMDCAVIVRFVSLDKFIEASDDYSEDAINPTRNKKK